MRVRALIHRIIQQLRRDKRTLALLFLAPLLVLTLMYFIFNGDDKDPTLVVTDAPTQMVEQFKKAKLHVVEKKHYSVHKLKKSGDAAWLDMKTKKLHLLNDDPTIAKQVRMILSGGKSTNEFKAVYVYGDSKTSLFDTFSPMLIGFFVFFFVFLIAGIALLKERTTGTLDRLLATPITHGEIISGYLIGYGIFAMIQTILIVLFSIYVLGIVSNGSILLVVLTCMIVALVALSLGTFLSSFANSEFQMVQFIPLVIVPQIFFSGIFPLETMATWLQNVGKVMPLYYAADALNSIMYKGLGFKAIYIDLLVLLLFAFIFYILNFISLRRSRSI
ncbi:MAG TPA: ABC transporter permease [Kurthia gibsonii]|uniref:ABC transporter permease n=2 Tax=Kurthia gibsonii TaxID=33946 RepID=UPI002D716A3F|nr:ABC transporter permease [Kurthia gibsonii]